MRALPEKITKISNFRLDSRRSLCRTQIRCGNDERRKRKLLLTTALPFSLFMAVFLFTPHFTFAYDFSFITDPIGNYFSSSLLGMAQALFKGGIWAVNLALSFTNSFLNDTDRLDKWRDIRNLSLGLFGVVILAIALMNLLRIEVQVWGLNRMLPKLFLAVFAVIFSKFIAISIINFATAIANTFNQGLGPTSFNNLLNAGMGVFGPDSNPPFATTVTIFIFSLFAFLIFLILTAVLYFRAVVLALLIAVSPLAFAMMVLPWTQKYFQEWWKNFLKWTFFFPVCIIILSISFSLIPDQSQPEEIQDYPKGSGKYDLSRLDPSKTYYCINSSGEEASPRGCVPRYPIDTENEKERQQGTDNPIDKFFGMLAVLFVPLVGVFLSVFLPLKMLGAAGEAVRDRMSGKKGIPLAPFDPKAAKGWWDKRSKEVDKRKLDRFSRGIKKGPPGMRRFMANKQGEMSGFTRWATKTKPGTIPSGGDLAEASGIIQDKTGGDRQIMNAMADFAQGNTNAYRALPSSKRTLFRKAKRAAGPDFKYGIIENLKKNHEDIYNRRLAGENGAKRRYEGMLQQGFTQEQAIRLSGGNKDFAKGSGTFQKHDKEKKLAAEREKHPSP